jgi:hypothetical protein
LLKALLGLHCIIIPQKTKASEWQLMMKTPFCEYIWCIPINVSAHTPVYVVGQMQTKSLTNRCKYIWPCWYSKKHLFPSFQKHFFSYPDLFVSCRTHYIGISNTITSPWTTSLLGLARVKCILIQWTMRCAYC